MDYVRRDYLYASHSDARNPSPRLGEDPRRMVLFGELPNQRVVAFALTFHGAEPRTRVRLKGNCTGTGGDRRG